MIWRGHTHLSLHFTGVPQGSVLGLLLFSLSVPAHSVTSYTHTGLHTTTMPMTHPLFSSFRQISSCLADTFTMDKNESQPKQAAAYAGDASPGQDLVTTLRSQHLATHETLGYSWTTNSHYSVMQVSPFKEEEYLAISIQRGHSYTCYIILLSLIQLSS